MFQSIRWRLVLSYLFLILLTLGVVSRIILCLGDMVHLCHYATVQAGAMARRQ